MQMFLNVYFGNLHSIHNKIHPAVKLTALLLYFLNPRYTRFRFGDFARIKCRGWSLVSSESSLDPRLDSREDRVEIVNLLLHGTVA